MISLGNQVLGGPTPQALVAWLALWRVNRVGPALFHRILEYFQDPGEVFYQSPGELLKLGFSQLAVQEIEAFAQKNPQSQVYKGVQADLHWLSQQGHHLVRCCDDAYPALLKSISDYPPLLFVKGNPEVLNLPQLAIVGSRNASQQGISIAQSFAGHLSLNNFTPTSGLALGIDAAAHQGAVEHDRPTIAVLAHGLDKVYPARNKLLAKNILKRGALISEFPIGVDPRPQYFPRRNRIISGMSLGVLVVEAAAKSGSLLTANLAAEQGREVFAIPGSIHNPLAKGCHHLIRQGAKLVDSVEHILEELAPLLTYQMQAQVDFDFDEEPEFHHTQENSPEATLPESVQADEVELSVQEQFLLNNLSDIPTSIDVLVARSGIEVSVVTSLMVMLEVKGLVKSVAGGYVPVYELIPET